MKNLYSSCDEQSYFKLRTSSVCIASQICAFCDMFRSPFCYKTSSSSSTTTTTLCLKNVPPLQLALIFTYTVRMRQFLAQMLPRKWAIKVYFIFPAHLTSASALPGETGNPESASFHVNAACCFIKKHETQLKVSPVRAEPPFTVKMIEWEHHTGPRKEA